MGGDHRGQAAAAPILKPAHQGRERALVAVGRLDLAADGAGVAEGEADGLGRSRGRPGGCAAPEEGGAGPGWRRPAGSGPPGEARARPARSAAACSRHELLLELGEAPGTAVGLVDEQRGSRRQVLEERHQAARVEARQERFHPEERRARVDGVEHLAHLGGGAVDLLGEVAHRAPCRLLALLGEERLARRDDAELRHVRAANAACRARRRGRSRSRRRRTRAGPAGRRAGSRRPPPRLGPRRSPGPRPAGPARIRARRGGQPARRGRR